MSSDNNNLQTPYPLDTLFSSNGFDVEIRQENNEYYFDVIHLESDKRYYSKINLPSNVTLSNLIESFENQFYQIFQIDDKIEIALIFSVNGSQQQENFVLSETTPTSGQEILKNHKTCFSNLYQNNQSDDDDNNNNLNNSLENDNINNDNNNFVAHDNLIINQNINNNNEKKLGNVKKIEDKNNIKDDLQNLQFNINNNDFFNSVINNVNDNFKKNNNNNNNNINDDNDNNNNNDNNNYNYNINNNNNNNNNSQIYHKIKSENNINYYNNNNYNNNNNNNYIYKKNTNYNKNYHNNKNYKQVFNNIYNEFNNNSNNKKNYIETKNNFILKNSLKEKNKNIQPALFNLQMLNKEYDNIFHRMFEISKELNKKNKINLKKNPYLFVSKQEMIDDINTNSIKSKYFVIYLLQCLLENVGVKTMVERKCQQPELASDLLQMIVSGIGLLPVYEFHMDFGDEENFKILFDKNVQKSYVENWKNRLAKTLHIDKKYIFITEFRNGSVKSKFFVGKKLKSNEKYKIKKEFQNELVKDSEIKEKGPLLRCCKLSTEMMEPKYDNYLKWAPKGEKRGGEIYDSPIGWMGFGLKVLGKYDNGDNKWIGMKNIPGEFPVAYHGVGRACKPFDIVNKIVDNGFVAGAGQQYANYEDKRHPGQKCLQGAYFTPIIDEAARYAGSGDVLDKKYKVVFMCRVNKDKIREPDRGNNAPYWILDGSKEQVRPYRILIKEN